MKDKPVSSIFPLSFALPSVWTSRSRSSNLLAIADRSGAVNYNPTNQPTSTINPARTISHNSPLYTIKY